MKRNFYDYDEELVEANPYLFADISNVKYRDKCKLMLSASLNHLKQRSTLIVMLVLIGTYILLGVIGAVNFQFFSNDIVQYVTTNLDIIVNALLGFFYGPVTCAIGVMLCTIVRMIALHPDASLLYSIGAFIAGFIHGWILYRHKIVWFGSRFRGFYTDLLTKVFVTRFSVSIIVNIAIMSVIYKIFVNYPFSFFFRTYSKSGVYLSTPMEFVKVFFVSAIFEAIVVFIALSVINFIVSLAFPSFNARPSLIINEDGEVINVEDAFEEMPEDLNAGILEEKKK